MSLGDRIRRLLERSAQPDPDEFVEYTVVPLSDGPMLVDRLRAAGVDATGSDAFSVVTQVRSDYRIMVRRRDLGIAERASAQP